MKKWIYYFLLSILMFMSAGIQAQKVYTIQADSVKITNCDSAELILENHTQGVPGFLFNTGRGRTVFQRGAVRLNDSMYVIGADTVTLPQRATDYWSLNGNYNTNNGAQYLGTNDENPLIFKTGSEADMWLFGGHLGLNTYGAPTTWALDVEPHFSSPLWGMAVGGQRSLIGNIGFCNGGDMGTFTGSGIRCDANTGLFFEGYSGGNGDWFVFRGSGGDGSLYGEAPRGFINGGGSTVRILGGTTGCNIGNQDMTSLAITPNYNVSTETAIWPMNIRGIYYNPTLNSLNGSRHIAIETVTGDVLLGTTSGNTGLGTSTPTAQLHTTGTVRFAGLTNDSTQTRVIVADDSGNLYYRSAASLAANDFIRSSLAVNGTITAKKLKLETKDWADYVFDSTYRLPGLDAVEAYLRREHHLPGIPSAGEVAKDGIDVGANQAALLKKIEELTLYSIQQDKKLQDQNNKLDTQEKELQLLKEQLAELKKGITKQ